MPGGRPPKDPEKRKLLGTGHRPVIYEGGISAAPARPACPAHLNPEARKIWRKTIPQLEAMGVLATVDQAMLASYCVHYERYIRLNRKLDEEGTTIRTAFGVKRNPLAVQVENDWKMWTQIALQYGLTQASRSRIKVKPVEKASARTQSALRLLGDNPKKQA